jgi:type VII secretion protein EccB
MSGGRDRYQGYRFAMRRQAGALLRPEQDTGASPLRRLSSGALGSVTIGIAAAAVAALFGLFSPTTSSSAWENSKALIVDAQTGTRYVYLSGQLHPVLDYASALLILKSGAVTATDVPHAQLSQAGIGNPIGIAGAPDALPATADLLGGTWSVCSSPAQTEAATAWALTGISLGAAPSGNALGTSQALLVQDTSGDEFLVWNGTRLAIPAGSGYVLSVLGASATSPVVVADAWLGTLPQGPDLVAPAETGQVERVGTGGAYYLRGTGGGLTALTPLQAQLLMAEQGQNSAATISAAEASSAQPAGGVAGLPGDVPQLTAAAADGTAVCVQYGGSSVSGSTASADPGQVVTAVTTRSQNPQILATTPAVTVDALGSPVADSVAVPSGHGALIVAQPNGVAGGGTEYLVTDRGVKYPLSGDSVLSDLGLRGAAAVRIPVALASILPTGPTLDETDALDIQGTDPLGTATATSTG